MCMARVNGYAAPDQDDVLTERSALRQWNQEVQALDPDESWELILGWLGEKPNSP